jgi:hypothetical protein
MGFEIALVSNRFPTFKMSLFLLPPMSLESREEEEGKRFIRNVGI